MEQNDGYFRITEKDYIFIFGGHVDDEPEVDTISIYDINQQQFRKCTLKCPSKDWYEAISVSNESKDELVVFGYVHEFEAEYKGLSIPLVLINRIQEYVHNEFIHLMTLCHKDNKHWRINIDDILEAMV